MAIAEHSHPTDRAPTYPPNAEHLPDVSLRQGRYELRFARSAPELDAVLRLRFAVFNLELGEGLRSSVLTGRDEDEFDAVCHHLVVIDRTNDEVVGTYRLQTAEMARAGLGFYTAREFELSMLPPEVREHGLELGRACIAREHRNTRVLFLLWRGIGEYVRHNPKRYLFGCCSLTSQDPREGHALLEQLAAGGAVHPEVWVRARSGYVCLDRLDARPRPAVEVPRLFEMYLAMGARVCSEPAIDREFRTIDYLVLFDVADLDERSRRRLLPGEAT